MLRSLLRSGAYSLLATVFSYLLIIALARISNKEALAGYLYATTWGLILTVVIDAAADQCSIHFKLAQQRSLAAALAAIFAIKCFMLLLAIVAVAASRAIGLDLPLTMLLFAIPSLYLGPVFEWRKQNAMFARILFFERLVIFVSSVGYTSAFGLDVGVYFLYFFVTLCSLASQIILLEFRLSRLKNVDPRALLGLSRRYAAGYWPSYLILMAQMGYGHFSRLLIEAKVGLVAFGAVTLAFQLTNAIQVIQVQVDRHFRPLVLQSVHEGDAARIRLLAGRYAATYVAPLALAALAVSLLSRLIVRIIFGPDWLQTADCLRYLSPLIATVPMLRFLDVLVVATNSQRPNLALNVVMILGLLAGLAAMPRGSPLPHYLVLVVAAQAMHVLLLAGYLSRRVPYAMAAQRAR